MILSNEQMTAALAGLTERGQWVEIPMETDTHDLPPWLLGLHIDWAMQYWNAPYVKFKVACNPMPEEVLWEQGPGGRWFREYGYVMEQLWNGGALTQMENGEWETTKTDGHGGRTTTIKLKDGRTVHLRGSWFGGVQDNWSEMTIVDMSDKYVKMDQRQGKDKWEIWPGSGNFKHVNRKAKAWYKSGGTYGLYVSDELRIKAISRFQPHVRLALVRVFDKPGGIFVEPFLDEWGMPKTAWLEKQRAIALANKK
jgi:hypothetical protein